jgi:hypothetical protein
METHLSALRRILLYRKMWTTVVAYLLLSCCRSTRMYSSRLCSNVCGHRHPTVERSHIFATFSPHLDLASCQIHYLQLLTRQPKTLVPPSWTSKAISIESKCCESAGFYAWNALQSMRIQHAGTRNACCQASSVHFLIVVSLSHVCLPGMPFFEFQMGFIGDKANAAVEQKVFAESGYPGLWKYRIVRFAKRAQTCSCCS